MANGCVRLTGKWILDRVGVLASSPSSAVCWIHDRMDEIHKGSANRGEPFNRAAPTWHTSTLCGPRPVSVRTVSPPLPTTRPTKVRRAKLGVLLHFWMTKAVRTRPKTLLAVRGSALRLGAYLWQSRRPCNTRSIAAPAHPLHHLQDFRLSPHSTCTPP